MYQQHANYASGLPVPSSPPNGQFWVHQGLPYQPPVIPQFNLAPELQQYVALIVGHSMMTIQQGAQRNELRCFYFNLCSANAWQNPAFVEHLTGVGQLAHLYMATQRAHPEAAIQAASTHMTDFMISDYARRHENYFAKVLTPEMVASVRDNLQRFAAISQQIQQFYSGGMQSNFGGGFGGGFGSPQGGMSRGPTFVGGGPAPGNFGGGFGSGGGGFPNRHVATASVPNNRLTSLNNLYRDDRTEPPPQMEDKGFMRSYGADRTSVGPTEELTMTPGQGVEHRKTQFPPPFNSGQVAEAPAQPTPVKTESRLPPPTHVPIDVEREWPKVYDVTRPYDSMVMETGEELRPAHTSGWTTTFNIESPYPLVYRLSDQMLFHVRRPDGEISEMVLERNETMGYLDNELDPELRSAAMAAAANPNLVSVLNWKGAALIQQVDGKPYTEPLEIPEDGTVELQVEAFPITDETVIQAHSLAEANVRLTLNYTAAGLQRDDSKTVEYYVDLLTPIGGDRSEARRVLATLRTANNFDSLLDALSSSRGKLGEEVFAVVDQRLTDRLNVILDKSMGLTGWSIDSFYNDLRELLQAIRETYNDSLIATLEDNYSDIVSPAIQVLNNNGLERYLVSIGSPETNPGKSNLLAFRDRVSVLNVPWSFDDMALEIRDGGLVSQTRLPEIYAVLEASFHRTKSSHIPFAHHYLVTKDQKRLEFRRGYLGRGAIILFPGG